MGVKSNHFRFLRVDVDAVRAFRHAILSEKAIPKGGLAASAGRLNQGVEIDRFTGVHVIANGFQVNLRALGVEYIGKNGKQGGVFGKLSHHQADEVVADYEVIHIRHLRQLPVAQVKHLADNGEGGLVPFGYITQMQDGDQGAGIRLLCLQPGITQDDDVVVIRRIDFLQ